MAVAKVTLDVIRNPDRFLNPWLIGEQVVPETVREHHDGVVRDRAGDQNLFHFLDFFTQSFGKMHNS